MLVKNSIVFNQSYLFLFISYIVKLVLLLIFIFFLDNLVVSLFLYELQCLLLTLLLTVLLV